MQANSFRLLLSIPLLIGIAAADITAQKAGSTDPFRDWIRYRAGYGLSFPERKISPAAKDLIENKVRPLIEKIIQSKDDNLTGQALLTFGAISPRKAMRPIISQIKAKNAELRKNALLAIALAGEAAASSVLAENLSLMGKSPAQAQIAAIGLGLIDPSTGAMTLNSKLGVVLTRSQKTQIQEIQAIICGLTMCATKGDAGATIALLEENRLNQPSLVGLTLWHSARLDADSCWKLTAKALKKRKEYREQVIASLGNAKKNAKEAAASLKKIAGSSREEIKCRVLAIEGLVKIGDDKSRKALLSLKKKIKGPLTHLVTVALGLIKYKDKKFIGDLLADLRGKVVPTRRAACALALSEIGGPTAGPALAKALKIEKDLDVKAAIIIALGRLGETASADILGQTFCTTEEPFLVQCSARALAMIAPGTDLPDKVTQDISLGKSTGIWLDRIRWSGWFGGTGVIAMLTAILADPKATPEAVTAALRALRVSGDFRPLPPTVRLLQHGPTPIPIAALTAAKQLVWGK